MLAGYIGGPWAGLFAGIICGLQRYTMGGITATACIVATCCIGTICGLLSEKKHEILSQPIAAFCIAALMEVLHLTIVLIMVKPYETALDIVQKIAIPMIVVNALGFMLMIAIIQYTEKVRSLIREKSRLKADLDIATVIQHSLLPKINAEYPNCDALDASALMLPARDVGGDFYDVFKAGATRYAFMIGDVSGKGISAALFMASSKSILQNCIRDNRSLAESIEIANNVIYDTNEAQMFITLWVGVFDYEDGSVKYVTAGHNPPVLLRNNEASLVNEKPNFVIGGMKDMKYIEHDLQLEKDDIVLLYTDGVTEAENAEHELFGDERLLSCLEKKSDCSAEEIINHVQKSVDDFVNGNDQFDDMTMLCYKWKGAE